MSSAPSVFLSHAHEDKRVARRLLRRLTAHGVKAWIDERELGIGTALTASIRNHIKNADLLLVVASAASALSSWVGLEMEFAQEHGKQVMPLFIEPVQDHERFRDRKGLDATSPYRFADTVQSFLRELFASLDREVPPADRDLLLNELRLLAREEPDLGPLINGCLDGEGLHQDNMTTVYGSAYHPLDEALNALFDLKPDENMAYHAAYGFKLAGAGVRALSSWIRQSGGGGTALAVAVGTSLSPPLLPSAIELLGACEPANNQALYQFIHENADRFDQAQRRAVVRLVTWPLRRDTGRFADVLGWVARKHFPEASEISGMWSRWIADGAFDGKGGPSTPRDLARYLADAHREQLPGWEKTHESLRSHVRSLARSGDKRKVMIAADHLRAAADHGAPVLPILLREMEGLSSTAEWHQWAEKDPETAEWSEWYVFHVVKEAAGDRNWLRALKDANEMVEFEKWRRRKLSEPEG